MKKKNLLFLLTVLCFSQWLFSQSVVFKPGPATGVDALLRRNDVCTNWQVSNNGAYTEIIPYAWTFSGLNCGNGEARGLLRFDDLNTLPAGAIITYAELRLFGVASSGSSQGNSNYPGSPFPLPNNSWVRRVTSPWTEFGVTWNTQPTITTVNQVAIPASNVRWNYNVALNVTNQVNAMMAPGQNHGFMIMLDVETYYRSVIFASSDHADSRLWPELYVAYRLPCDAHFTWCGSTRNPGLYNFTAGNPQSGYNYTWYFGDGTSATGLSASHTFAAGTYQVCLEAYNPQTGDRCRECTSICVEQPAGCTADFNAVQRFGYLYNFAALTTTGLAVASYSWDFGNGSTSTAGPSVKHSYAAPGFYTVCLTVRYVNGCEARYCKEIEVVDLLDPAKTALPPGDLPPLKNLAENAGDGLRVTPNPVNSGTATLNFDAATTGLYRYTLFDAQGKPAATASRNVQKGVQHIEVNVSALPPGRYVVELSGTGEKMRTPFIKL